MLRKRGAGHLEQERVFQEAASKETPPGPGETSLGKQQAGPEAWPLNTETEGPTQDCFPGTIYSLHCQPFLWVIRYKTGAKKAHPSCYWILLSLACRAPPSWAAALSARAEQRGWPAPRQSHPEPTWSLLRSFTVTALCALCPLQWMRKDCLFL